MNIPVKILVLCIFLAISSTVLAFSRHHALKFATTASSRNDAAKLLHAASYNQDYSSDIWKETLLLSTPIIGLPLFPHILSRVTDLSTMADERQVWTILLLLTKRLYLYAVAFSSFYLGTWIAAQMPYQSLGQRFKDINEDIFGKAWFDDIAQDQDAKLEYKTMFETIDSVPEKQQGLILPLILISSLFSAYILLHSDATVIGNVALPIERVVSSLSSVVSVLPGTQQIFPWLSAVPNIIMSLFFARLQISNIVSAKNLNANSVGSIASQKHSFENLEASIAIVLVALATLSGPGSEAGMSFWWTHNVINTFLVMTMCRLVQFKTLPIIVLVLVALMGYDALAVFGTRGLTDDGKGVMEAVALTKLQSLPLPVPDAAESMHHVMSNSDHSKEIFKVWTPGLFEVVINGRVSDALGLGDVIFPAILGTWARRLDHHVWSEEKESGNATQRHSYFTSVSSGYLVGCLLCEVFQTGQGQPALVFLVPAMMLSLLVKVLATGKAQEVWRWSPSSVDGKDTT